MTTIANTPVAVYDSVQALQGQLVEDAKLGARYDGLARDFESRYKRKPTYIIRAPGRVNIIGEHIDYSLFGVLPAAIENDLVIAIAPSVDGLTTVQNTEAKFTPASFQAQRNSEGKWDLDIDPKALRWESYVKAGYLGVLERYFIDDKGQQPTGFEALFTSTIPPGSGVSSSAALIVASTLAFLAINDKLDSLTKGDLVQMSVGNEKKVGVNSGGMDQSASILSTPGSALYISFFPSLQASPTTLPKSPAAAFVIANSLTVSNKAETGKHRYNLRVVETLVGARILAIALGLPVDKNKRKTYREVLAEWWAKSGNENQDEEEDLMRALNTILDSDYLDGLKGKTQDGVTLEEMIEKTGLQSEEFNEIFLSWVEVEAEYFQLYKRAKHVFSEALRVLQFRKICLVTSKKLSNSVSNDDRWLNDLGDLMDTSQESCAKLYECSCPELDQLTSVARRAGAYGSRLTGAGWGGCTVSLVAQDKVDTFIQTLRREYPPYKELDDETFKATVFATRPGEGAYVLKVSE